MQLWRRRGCGVLLKPVGCGSYWKWGKRRRRRRRGKILVYQEPPPCLLRLSFLWQRTDAVTYWGQSILRAVTKQTSNDTVGQKVGPIKMKSMNTILTGREKHTPILSFFSWKIPTIHFTERCNGGNTCSTASTYFNQFPGAGFHRSLADNTLWNNATVCFSKPTWQAAWQWGSLSTCHVSPLIGHKDLPPWNLVALHTSSQGLQTRPI